MVSNPKYIFCTGGVVSSVGKGVTAAAVGRILKARGFKVAIQKLDPYLNVDPGTMSPYQHGEVFVTSDGAETDLDLGHYERFIDERLDKTCNVTAGQVYSHVIDKERHGDYLGGTIQVIPHITNEIKRRILMVGKETNADIVIVEVGGTVGDIEGQPFLEAIRQMRTTVGRNDSLFIHVTFLPYIGATRELKTKPTQHSVRELRGIGIQPQVIIARTDYEVGKDVTSKIALFCDVEERAVIALKTTDLIYDVPLVLEDAGLGDYLVEQLRLEVRKPDLAEWRSMVSKMRVVREPIRIGVVGKYIELHDAYMSVKEALFHAATLCDRKLEIQWINSTDLEKERAWEQLKAVNGVVVPGGFGYRGVEGKVLAARFARENKVPYLGLCLGMQTMCIEFARDVLGYEDANSSEFETNSEHFVIDMMLDQRGITDLGGTMRLGVYPCELKPQSVAATAYGSEGTIEERHRHRFEFNNNYREQFEAHGMQFSGLSPSHELVEIAELAGHPFMLGTQFHPEFLSRPNAPHPLFVSFIRSAITHQQSAAGSD
ncbi:MAG: CTP synthase [Anaerolineae bacterium]|nr:CTP synthase [Anaerolineae bacterium]NUQ02540.1 CTP synthase [Anaerolineae bacterium]